jgi:hypothetical protein
MDTIFGRRRPDSIAVEWSSKVVDILEFRRFVGKNGSSRSAEEGQGRPLVPMTSTDHDVPYPAGCLRPDRS